MSIVNLEVLKTNINKYVIIKYINNLYKNIYKSKKKLIVKKQI